METASRNRALDKAARVAAYAAFYDHVGRADLLGGVAFERGVPPLTRLRLLLRAALKFGRFAVDFRRQGGVSAEAFPKIHGIKSPPTSRPRSEEHHA
jgi:hypothetical protein